MQERGLRPFQNPHRSMMGAYLDEIALFDDVRCSSCPDNAGFAEFTAYNGCVAGDTAFVRDNAGGAAHERDEFGTGHAGDKDVAILKTCEVLFA